MTEFPAAWTSEQHEAGQQTASAWQDFFASTSPSVGAAAIEETARVAEIKAQYELELLRRDNVVGVATSLKVTGGQPTEQQSLTVFVERKLPPGEVGEESKVPEEMDGVPTDVVEVGRIVPLTFNARVRPAAPGYSIGHYNITAGTFGCLVRDIRRCCAEENSGDYFILSNNHVLADTNLGKPGDVILQPGAFDGGVFPADEIATLERFEPIVFGASGYNLVDAAVARPTFSRNVISSIIGLVTPTGIGQAFVGSDVIKVGRTTQVTTGRVLAVDATVQVGYGVGVAQFRHQIITTAMSAGGDSGSLLMNAELNAVGLLFAGSSEITIHNHIADVEIALGVRSLTAPRSG